MEDLQVAEILWRETLLALLFAIQLKIAGVTGDEPVEVRLEEIFENEVALRFAQIFGTRQGTVKKRIGCLAGSVFLYLRHHRRHQVEGLVNGWKLGQDFNHSGVILHGVE